MNIAFLNDFIKYQGLFRFLFIIVILGLASYVKTITSDNFTVQNQPFDYIENDLTTNFEIENNYTELFKDVPEYLREAEWLENELFQNKRKSNEKMISRAESLYEEILNKKREAEKLYYNRKIINQELYTRRSEAENAFLAAPSYQAYKLFDNTLMEIEALDSKSLWGIIEMEKEIYITESRYNKLMNDIYAIRKKTQSEYIGNINYTARIREAAQSSYMSELFEKASHKFKIMNFPKLIDQNEAHNQIKDKVSLYEKASDDKKTLNFKKTESQEIVKNKYKAVNNRLRNTIGTIYNL